MKIIRSIIASIIVIILCAGIFLFKGELAQDQVDAKYTSEKSQFFTMENGARIHFRDEGNPNGPAVVLVHGSNASLHTWEPWLVILGESYRIITMDLPAHGLTGAVPDKRYGSPAQLRTGDAVVRHLGIDKFTLGGNSMGGGVTWRYTLAHPEKVEAMLLIDSSGLPQFRQLLEAKANELDQDKKEAPVFFSLMRKPWFRAIAKYIDPYWMTKQGVNSAYNYSPMVTEELIQRYYELALRDGSRDATLSRFSTYNTTEEPVDAGGFSVPALIMWGREDSLIPVDVAELFSTTLAQSTLVIYDNVGHMPMEEIPNRSAKDVSTFLFEVYDSD
jgi:pimeloyl-ACP methyl ester carboxylesterase